MKYLKGFTVFARSFYYKKINKTRKFDEVHDSDQIITVLGWKNISEVTPSTGKTAAIFRDIKIKTAIVNNLTCFIILSPKRSN